MEENVSFDEIIEMMACAEDYSDLYYAAGLIENEELQKEVVVAIGEYEDDDTPVEEAYSIVTSDILDMYVNDENVKDLKECKQVESCKCGKGKCKEESCKCKKEESVNGSSLYDWMEAQHFEASFDIADKEYDMMVAFDFDPEKADNDPFDSFMAMLAKQLDVIEADNGIVEVNLCDYVTRNFDLLDAIFDTGATTPDEEMEELVCEIMPAVISGATTDSVYTELLNGSKVVESKKITEGAGAGYSVEGTVDYDSIKVNSFEVVEKGEPDKYGDYAATIKCDIDAKLDDVSAESYYYGSKISGLVPVKISKLVVTVGEDNSGNEVSVDEYSIRDALDNLHLTPMIGGGWSHQTFDGNLSCDYNKFDANVYSAITIEEIEIGISSDQVISAIDRMVQGNNYSEEYTVVKDEEVIDSFYKEDEAINYAKDIKADRVELTKWWEQYSVTESGDVEVDVEDSDDTEVVWENEDLEESKQVESKSSFDDYKDYCNDLGIDCNKTSSLNKYMNDYTKNEVQLNGSEDIEDKSRKVKSEIRNGLRESKKLQEVKKIQEAKAVVKDENLFEEFMSYLYGDSIKDGYGVGDDSDILNDIQRYTYLGGLIELPKDEEDMEDEEILALPQFQALCTLIKDQASKLEDVKMYNGELELSDRALLQDFNNEAVYNAYGDEGALQWYWEEADSALEQFAADNGIDPDDITYDGRGARHIVIPATYENAIRYDELVAKFQVFQDEFIDRINSYDPEVDESKKVEESAVDNKVKEIADFLKDSVKTLQETDYTCCHYKFDNDLGLYVGWTEGYDPDDEDYIHSKNDPSFVIAAKIGTMHEYMKTDLDWINQPYNKETGDVWDTDMTLSGKEDYEKVAQEYINQYKEIRTALDNGEVVLESKKVEEKEADEERAKNTKIKDWYKKEFPDDEFGDEIADDITFYDAFEALDNRKDFYEFLNVGDSVVRERVFNELADIMGVDYDYIYQQWLLESKK